MELKEKQVLETLQHLGKVKSFELLPIIPSPKIWEYRNKIELSFGYEKMWVEKDDENRIYHDENPCLGFHASEKWEEIVPLDTCNLFTSKISKILKIFNDVLKEGKFTVYNPKTHKGLFRQLVVRRTEETDDLMVNLVINSINMNHNPKRGSHNNGNIQDKKLKFSAQFGNIIKDLSNIEGMQSILITESDSLSDALNRPKAILMWGTDCIYEKIDSLKFKISPFSFFQTNTKAAEKLYEKVSEFADLQGREKVLDLYCGTGAIGLCLAQNAQHVYGFDIDPEAINDAKENARLNNVANVEFICGAIEKELRTLGALIKDCRIEQVIVDPPRAGMHKNVVSALTTARIKKIVYVSCNPATLARDVEKFTKSGYELVKVQPVDMFPHTAHVETVSELLKK